MKFLAHRKDGGPYSRVTGFKVTHTPGRPRKAKTPNGIRMGTPLRPHRTCTLSPDEGTAMILNEAQAVRAEKLLKRDYPNAVVNVLGSL